MGQTPAKFFPWPTPYGQSPNSNVVSQAQAAPQMPQQNYLPLNPAASAATTQSPAAPTNPLQPVKPNPLLGGRARSMQ